MIRPARKLAANGTEKVEALAAQPAMERVAASLAIRKTTSSVSKRLAYRVNPTPPPVSPDGRPGAYRP